MYDTAPYRLCQYRVNSPHRLRLHLQPGDMRPMDQAAGAQALQTPYAVAKAGIIPSTPAVPPIRTPLPSPCPSMTPRKSCWVLW